jgi:Glyoxalase/Bleomycin resistance protein/Dioxygenase superfamily
MEHLSKLIDADSPLLEKKADQFGYVVPDLEQAIKGWIDQGVGPWFTVGPVVVTDYKYLERPSLPLLIFGFCQVGGVQLELIQPLDDAPSSYRAFLAAGRSGFQHCGFFVEPHDYQRSVSGRGVRCDDPADDVFFGRPHRLFFPVCSHRFSDGSNSARRDGARKSKCSAQFRHRGLRDRRTARVPAQDPRDVRDGRASSGQLGRQG